MNTFGRLYRFTTFGESHGPCIGGIIDGVPSGIDLDLEFIQYQLNRRRPGQSDIVSNRKEKDKVEFLSGIFNGKTTGAPLAFVIKNSDKISKHYNITKNLFRPSHGDYTYFNKYGKNFDYRGSGRYSARETAVRVVAGAIAQIILKKRNISITAYVSKIGSLEVNKPYYKLDLTKIETNQVRCPDESVAKEMYKLIRELKIKGDTVGGEIMCVIKNLPAGLGEPIYDKFSARLAYAMLSINAAKGFEFGRGFLSAEMKGSEYNDLFFKDKDGKIRTITNNSGGIQAGITNGMDVYFRVAFKPVSTIFRKQQTLTRQFEEIEFIPEGRHDSCVVPRAVPIVEAMASVVALDFLLLHNAYKNV